MVGLNFCIRRIGASGATCRALIALALAGAVVTGYAQQGKTVLVVPPAPLLPARFSAWELPANTPECVDCLHPDGETGTVMKEAGLLRASRKTYGQAGTPASLQVDAFQFDDATGAVSAYTYLRKPEMRSLPAGKRIGSDAVASPDGRFLFLAGTTVVEAQVSRVTPATVDELQHLATTLPKVGGPKGSAPLLPSLLPAKGLDVGSVRYAVGPVTYAAEGGVLPAGILGWDKSGETVTARYGAAGAAPNGAAANAGRNAAEGRMLTLLLYPTPQIAGDRGRAIEAALNASREKYGTVKLRREGPMLVLATGQFSAAQEADLVGAVHLPLQLTWDKKMPLEFHAEVGKTYSLLASIAAFCGVGAVAAVCLGLFLGGGRAAIRVMQGKPAASEPEFLRIDLRGKSAPIHMDGPTSG